MLSLNDEFRDFLNVTAWHNAGYFGEGVRVGNAEWWELNSFNPDGLCSSQGNVINWDDGHGEMTARAFYEIAPKASMEQRLIVNDFDEIREEAVNMVLNDPPDLFTMSLILLVDEYKDRLDFISQIKDKMCLFLCAGNDDVTNYNPWAENADLATVGAIRLVNGKPQNESYSSETEYIDFGSMARLYIDESTAFAGTSCSTPVLCGMMALVQELFLKKTGKTLDFDTLYQFMEDHAVDLSGDGFDNKEGHGYVVLPNPEDVDVWYYANKEFEKEEDGMYIDDFYDAEDVASWFKEDVQWALDKGLMEGVGDNKFDPKGVVTREMLACLLHRYSDMDK